MGIPKKMITFAYWNTTYLQNTNKLNIQNNETNR